MIADPSLFDQLKTTRSYKKFLFEKILDKNHMVKDERRAYYSSESTIPTAESCIYAIGVGLDGREANREAIDYSVVVYLDKSFLNHKSKIEGQLRHEYGRDNPIAFRWGKPAKFAACDPTTPRPTVSPGISCSANSANYFGTLGFLCSKRGDDTGETYLCSNNHVIAGLNQFSVGHEVVQPSAGENSGNQRCIAKLDTFVPINRNLPNLVDAAIAKINKGVALDSDICCIGGVHGIREPIAGEKVMFHGRSSGLSYGIVTDIDHDQYIGGYHFSEQIVIQPMNGSKQPIVRIGDSGSLVVSAEENYAVGMVFALDDGYAIANKIGNVLSELGVTIL